MIGIVLAALGALAGFLGDWFNNTYAIVDANATMVWKDIINNAGMICVAFVFALAVALLGFYVGMRRRYYLALAVAVVCSSGLTVYGRYTHIETKELRAETQADYRAGLLSEKTQLQDDLNPADPNKKPCVDLPSRVCRVADHNARLTEINNELRELATTGITGTPGDKYQDYMQAGMLGIVSLGLPIVNCALSGLCGWLVGRRRAKKVEAESINDWVTGRDHGGNVTRIDRWKKKLTGPLSSLQTSIKKRFTNQSSDPRTGLKETGPVENEGTTSLCYYELAKKAVLDGNARPSTTGLKDHGIRGRREDLQEYLRRMAKEGILIPPTKNGGKYKMNDEYGKETSFSDFFRKTANA